MAVKFTPSVNIIRDEVTQLEYLVTPNAERVAKRIGQDFNKGVHSFTLIGSYGTGKSSFLWAFEKSLKKQSAFLPVDLGLSSKKTNFLKIVGAYQSITEHFAEILDVRDSDPANRNILDALHQEYEKTGSMVLLIDEFGKFLEYAVKHNPQKELYFLQQLAEVVNQQNKNFLLLTTLHQSFEAYGNNLKEVDRLEWRKVKGRFHEITFNEPVEQLLELAARKLKDKKAPKGFSGSYYSKLAKKHQLRSLNAGHDNIESSLYPLDIISATVLTLALQRYGQNERSLFNFLELEAASADRMGLSQVYDYLYRNYYSSLQSNTTSNYSAWRMLERGIERVELELTKEAPETSALIKTIGLLQIFVPNARIDSYFLKAYLQEWFSSEQIEEAITNTEKRKITVFTHYNQSYKLIDGTDLDFDLAIRQAGEAVADVKSLVPLLEEHFEFPVIQAKSISYKNGTPRLFDFVITEKPISDYKPDGAFDGAVNLIFNELVDVKEVERFSKDQTEPIIYGFFENTAEIRENLFELLRTKKVLVDNQDDLVAKRELQIIIRSRETLLQHQVLDAMYSHKVAWLYKGKPRLEIVDARSFNHFLSTICEEVYNKTPRFINELANKHKVSSPIHSARKNYFTNLVEHWKEEDLGFEQDKFPPEKTIYITLLKENGMHFPHKGGFELGKPNDTNGFQHIWKASEEFLDSSSTEKKSITSLIEALSQKPYKIKQGLIDFWVPTFLFIHRADFALYEEDRFVPFINDAVLYMMTRNPERYSIKAFEISGIRLTVFNKYRELLELEDKPRLTNEAFIESIRPFLVFYKNLDEYAKNTTKLEMATLELRQAITTASSPEKTFFEDFPAALGMDLKTISEDEKALQDFFAKVNASIDELKGAYSKLVERIDLFIRQEILATSKEFPSYKKELSLRFKNIKEHRLLPKQGVFLQRLQSELDDRDSWIASIAQAVLGKSLNKITDAEEEILKDRLAKMLQELQNLSTIHSIQKSDDEVIIKLDITTSYGLKENNIRIPKGKQKEIDSLVEELNLLLNANKQLKLPILAQLLKNELNE